MIFATKAPGPLTWELTPLQLALWSDAYRLDVYTECLKAGHWIAADPSRRKTARGMPRFLVAWLNRASERTLHRLAVGHRLPRYPEWTCPHVDCCERRSICQNKLTIGTVKYPLKKAVRRHES